MTDSGLEYVRCPHCLKLNAIERERRGQPPLSGSFRCVACHRIASLTPLATTVVGEPSRRGTIHRREVGARY
jgi:DNA-directed RNA polymerase subunit RPC12/RpoP